MTESQASCPVSAQPPAISEAQVQGLASVGATEQEICDYLGLTPEQLEADFGPVLRRRRAWFRITLRQRQFNIATQEKGDPRMLQWLGRSNLNQGTASPVPATAESQVKTYVGIDPEEV